MNRAEQVVAALRREPSLLFEVLSLLNGTKIAGPWSRATMTYRERRSTEGRLLCRIEYDSTRPLPWRGMVCKDLLPFTKADATGGQPRERAFPSESEAMDWCEAALIAASYIMV